MRIDLAPSFGRKLMRISEPPSRSIAHAGYMSPPLAKLFGGGQRVRYCT